MGREIKRVPLDFKARGAWDWKHRYTDKAKGYGEFTNPPPEGPGWQVWETVSEGSPISPVFATPEELAKHLSTVGDDWHAAHAEAYRTRIGPRWQVDTVPRPLPSYEAALAFVKAGWGCSLVLGPGGMAGPYGEKL